MAARAPLYEAQFAGSHNSFNASSYLVPLNGKPVQYYPTLTNQDPNQVYSITDQLRMDIRGLEIDLHWVPSIYGNASTGGYWVDVCHGQSTAIPNTPLSRARRVHDRPVAAEHARLRCVAGSTRTRASSCWSIWRTSSTTTCRPQHRGVVDQADVSGKLVYRPPASLQDRHVRADAVCQEPGRR